jgi:hypothetical protein
VTASDLTDPRPGNVHSSRASRRLAALREYYGGSAADAARPAVFRVAILTLAAGAVLAVYLGLAVLGLLPGEQGSRGFTIAGAVVLLGAVSVLRKERGPLGAAAAIVALGAAGFVLFSYVFAYTVTWLMHVFMPD